MHVSTAHPQPNPGTASRSNRFHARWPEWIALVLYTGLVAFAIPWHEPWADEAQAWQLARNVSLHDLFHIYLGYEGSPGLWHLLLKLLIHLHVSYGAMHWICGGIAVAGIAILLLYSPFPRYIKLLLPFTFFLAFQYAIVARSYVLVPLLLFSIAALWRRSVLLLAVLLGLLGNTALHVLAFSGGLTIVYGIEIHKRKVTGESIPKPRSLWLAALLLLASYAFAVWSAWPREAVYGGHYIPGPSGIDTILLAVFVHVGRSVLSLSQGVTQPSLLAIPLWIALTYWMHKRQQVFYLIPIACFALFSTIYLSFWHAGLIIPLTIAVLWIAGATGPEWQWPTRLREKAILAAGIYLAVVQIGWMAYAVVYDYRHEYAASVPAARFLTPYVEAGDRIAVAYTNDIGARAFESIDILPYFSRQVYMNQEKAFWWFSPKNRILESFPDVLAKKPDVIVVEFLENHTFDLAHDPSDPTTASIVRAGYSLTHVFCAKQPMRFDYELPACHLIYQTPR